MSIKRNFIYNLSYQLLIMILPLITTPYIARVIGADGVGIQSYTYSIANYFVLFAMLGIYNHGNRSIAMVREDKTKVSKVFFSIYYIQLIMSLIMIILYSLYIIFIAKEYKLFFIIQIIYIVGALLDINWFFFGMEQFKLTVARNTIIKIITVCSIFIFVKNSQDLWIYSLLLAVGSIASQGVLWVFLRKFIIFQKVSLNDIKEHIKPVIILFIPVISISLYKVMDKIMLGNMSSVTQVGFFENSEKIINIPIGVITALGTVMLPKAANLLASGNDEESKKYIFISIKFVSFIAIGSIFGLIGVGGTIIPIFLGEGFRECINIVAFLSITILFIAWANVIRTQYLIPKQKDKIYIKSTFFGAIINIIINLLLINRWGAIGAAIGTIFAEGVVAIYQIIKVRHELQINRYIKSTVFFIIPGIIMCLVTLKIGKSLGESWITAIIQIGIGGIIYVLISLIYMISIKDEIIINMINKLSKKK